MVFGAILTLGENRTTNQEKKAVAGEKRGIDRGGGSRETLKKKNGQKGPGRIASIEGGEL